MAKEQEETKTLPPQHQEHRPGHESEMTPRPKAEKHSYKGSGKLYGRVALITGGDSGIGRAVAIAFAKEGADVAIVYLNEHEDAQEIVARGIALSPEGRHCFARMTVRRLKSNDA